MRELDDLKQASAKLAELIAPLEIDVFVPLYANTFPLATIAKRARLRPKGKNISIEHFEWGWDGSWSKDLDEPPFLSPKQYQIFFATEAEFTRIHAAGISFFAVPVSVFHPKYIFLGVPSSDGKANIPTIDTAGEVKSLICNALGIRTSRPRSARARKRQLYDITWVSDVPNQADALAQIVQVKLNKALAPQSDSTVNFWQTRTLESSLGIPSLRARTGQPVKAFIWGGPLASAALQDVPEKNASPKGAPRQRYGWPRLRDQNRPSVSIPLKSLLTVLKPAAKIRLEHALYCCVGYKETRNLASYYIDGRHLERTPWVLTSKKFREVDKPEITVLISSLKRFFSCLFVAAARVAAIADDTKRKRILRQYPIFEEFRSDYDKHCRTLNPIAQLYTAEEYVKCLRDHHDAEAFKRLFPR